MFYAPKYARLSRIAATSKNENTGKAKYDINMLSSAVQNGDLILRDGIYHERFETPVIGNGPNLPASHNPEHREGYGLAKGVTEQDVINDVKQVIADRGLEWFVDAANGGMDLKSREGAFQTYKASQRKLSDSDKFAWLWTNRPDQIKPGMSVQTAARIFDEIHGASGK